MSTLCCPAFQVLGQLLLMSPGRHLQRCSLLNHLRPLQRFVASLAGSGPVAVHEPWQTFAALLRLHHPCSSQRSIPPRPLQVLGRLLLMSPGLFAALLEGQPAGASARFLDRWLHIASARFLEVWGGGVWGGGSVGGRGQGVGDF